MASVGGRVWADMRRLRPRVLWQPLPSLPPAAVNFVGFLRSVKCESEAARLESFEKLFEVYRRPRRAAKKLEQMGVKGPAIKRLARAMNDYAEGYMPRLYAQYHRAKA